MPRVRFSDTRDWELLDGQDLRGWDLWDAQGHWLGTITDLLVDTEAQRVEAILLDSGEEYPADHLMIGEDAIYVDRLGAAGVEPRGPMRQDRRRYEERDLRRREPLEGSDRKPLGGRQATPHPAERGVPYSELAEGFREHYRHTYGNDGLAYADWEPAYRFGYNAAFEPSFAGRDFEAVEPALRRGYYQRHGYPMKDRVVWHHVRHAVRHAFERARRGTG